MGDFNAKVGAQKINDIVGPFGLGSKNKSGDLLINYCVEKLFLCNTWFQQKDSARHTWISPDKVTKTKIDFVCVSKRYRNAVTNAKTRPGADCGSDHNPVMNLKVKLKKLKKILHTKKWDLGKINNEEVRANFCQKLLEKMQIANTSFQVDNVINNWKNLKEALETTAKEVIGYKKQVAIKQWMTQEIPDLMDERGRYKNSNSDEEKQKYIRAKNTYPKNV